MTSAQAAEHEGRQALLRPKERHSLACFHFVIGALVVVFRAAIMALEVPQRSPALVFGAILPNNGGQDLYTPAHRGLVHRAKGQAQERR